MHDLNLKKLKRYSGYLPIEGTESWFSNLYIGSRNIIQFSSAGTKREFQVNAPVKRLTSLLAHFETATVVKSRYSGVSLADSTTQRANGFFFTFSLAKLRGYFFLLKAQLFSRIYTS